MAEARQRSAWDHTSALMALFANVHRDPRKGRALKPSDFHPMAQRSERTVLRGDGFGVLKRLFARQHNPLKQGGKQP
jgi:hypothetical protein